MDNCDQDKEEMYQADKVSTLRLDVWQLVTLRWMLAALYVFKLIQVPNATSYRCISTRR